MFFANVWSFTGSVLNEVDEQHPKAVVINAEAITDIETTVSGELVKLLDELPWHNVMLAFARLQDPVGLTSESGGLDVNDRDCGRVECAIEGSANQ